MDLTTTANHAGRMTGIARVELALARNLRELLGEQLRFVVYCAGRFYEYEDEQLDHLSLARFLHLLVSGRKQGGAIDPAGTAPLFLISGSAWMQNSEYSKSVKNLAEAHNVDVGIVVFDLIPILFPYWYEADYAGKFRASINQILEVASVAFCISTNTAKDLSEYCQQDRINTPKICVFRLGDNVQPDAQQQSIPGSNGALSDDFMLAVGAIHKRKNYELLFDALRVLRDQGFTPPKLVIAGGWMPQGREIARIAIEDEFLKDAVEIVSNVDDAELARLYQSSLFTLYPSVYEGWGLPVCESFQFGKVCLASDAASITEILPKYEHFLAPLDTGEWASRIRYFTANPVARSGSESWIREHYRSWSWKNCAEQFQNFIEEFLRERGKNEIVRSPGNDETRLEPIFDDAWSGPGQYGRWSEANCATIKLPVPRRLRTKGKLILALEVRAASPQNINIEVDRSDAIRSFVTTESAPVMVELEKLPEKRSEIEVRISCDHLIQDDKLSRSPVGIAVRSLQLVSLRDLRAANELTGRPNDRRLIVERNPLTLWGIEKETQPGLSMISVCPSAGMQVLLNLVVPASDDRLSNCMVLVNNSPTSCFTVRCGSMKTVQVPIGCEMGNSYRQAQIEVIALDTQTRSRPLPAKILEYELDSRKLLCAPEGAQEILPLLPVGQTVKFGNQEDETSIRYLAFGWQSLERYGAQSAIGTCILEFYIDQPLEKWRLLTNLKSRSSEAETRVRVLANGHPVGELNVSSAGLRRYNLDCVTPVDTVLRLEFCVESNDENAALTMRHFAIVGKK
ncbi:MAG: glycosyltransferase family 1 protein [Cyanobacteria bacterium J06638_22]